MSDSPVCRATGARPIKAPARWTRTAAPAPGCCDDPRPVGPAVVAGPVGAGPGAITLWVAVILAAILAVAALVADGGARIRTAERADIVAGEAARAASYAANPTTPTAPRLPSRPQRHVCTQASPCRRTHRDRTYRDCSHPHGLPAGPDHAGRPGHRGEGGHPLPDRRTRRMSAEPRIGRDLERRPSAGQPNSRKGGQCWCSGDRQGRAFPARSEVRSGSRAGRPVSQPCSWTPVGRADRWASVSTPSTMQVR